MIGLESLLLAERLLEIFLLEGHVSLLHLPILLVWSSVCLLIIKEFILRIPLKLIVLILIEKFILFPSISLALHLFLLLLCCRLLGGESPRMRGEIVWRGATALEGFAFEFHGLFYDFLGRFISRKTAVIFPFTLLTNQGRRGVLWL